MCSAVINPRKIVVFTGAGISAASGLSTFRSAGGLWEQHRIEDVATPEAWARNPKLVLSFYNARREALRTAQPNPAHRAIARLESHFDVVVVTQNVDDLHERGGSTKVIHVHGELRKARSTVSDEVFEIGYDPIGQGQCCPRGGQLRPHIVWFGEEVMHLDQAALHFEEASKVLVVGTSLSVFPAAGLVRHARHGAEKILVDPDPPAAPYGFATLRGAAEELVPQVADGWLSSLKRTGVEVR